MHSLGAIGHFILTPLYYAISAVLVGWHELFSLVLPADGGMSWVLSIVGLTIVIRAALIPLFVKQINASRNMQLIQPKVKELQKKYGHDREKLAQETMALYRESGTNPFASCLPLLVQSPIFIALFRLLDQAAKNGTANGFMTQEQADSFGHAKLFGHIPISATFLKPFDPITNERLVSVQILAAILVIAMTATTFTTQRQLMTKNMPANAMTGQYAQQQKMLLYVLPVVFAVGGVAFPIGVLFYWTTTNLWTMGQQFYVIRRNPAPGTPAFDAKQTRDRAKGRVIDEPADADGTPPPEVVDPPRKRQQPKRQSRQQRKRSGGAKPGGPQKRDDGEDDAENEGEERMSETEQTEQAEPADVAESSEQTEVGDQDVVDEGETREPAPLQDQLEQEGDIAADYLEELLDIADLDGDLDMDVEGERAMVSIVGADLQQLVGNQGTVLDALQELTRLAVYRETGERSRLMLDISGHRAARRLELEELAAATVSEVKESGERAALRPMTPFERKVVHDAVAAAGLTSESEGVEPRRFVVVLPA